MVLWVLYGLIEQPSRLPLVMSLYKFVYSKPYYLLVEIEHRVWCTIQMLNYDLTNTCKDKRLQLSEVEEIQDQSQKSARSYKERAKLFHDIGILSKEFGHESAFI